MPYKVGSPGRMDLYAWSKIAKTHLDELVRKDV